ncbi:MAG: 2Fe-2S iron-sulfur cluster-binding protein [Weeksellaceae bacterium]|jgi:ring-1,2-phenylacetyl-CoA epoxidase subunit PaaE|nr:2Fe-2S iron-sulfur cluster-binding protein [Weeksellaceae bacterium]
MEFHNLTVKKVQKLTPVSVAIDFDVPEELKPDFEFKAGQYITLDILNERRDYSLCSSPLEGRWSVGIKALSNGKVSTYINSEIKEGDTVKVSTPNGRFGIPSRPDEKRTILAFVAGSGITPILSVLKYTLETEKWVNFHLFYSNRTPQDVMFKEELEEIKQKYPFNFFPYLFYSQHKVDNWLFEGRLDAPKFQLILNQLVDINEVDEALVCGPNKMIRVITDEIHSAGIPKENIHFELFSTEGLDRIQNENAAEQTEVKVTVELDGEVSTLTWDTKKNLVDAMLDAGIDAPYSCKGGICSSCMCKLEKGEVVVGENFILTESDEEEGIILACCSRPKSDEIRINFDAI